MNEQLVRVCEKHGVLALYLFGSRAEDGVRVLAGEPVATGGSDLDVGVFFEQHHPGHNLLASLLVDLEDLFSPLRVDLVPLASVDALFQFRAIDGRRVYSANRERVARLELDVLRRAADLLPTQRRLERELFGVATS
jgi:predicted nucleotidyltransferase